MPRAPRWWSTLRPALVARTKIAARWAALLLTPLAVGYGLWQLPSIAFFHVQRVEVRGVRFVSPDSLIAALRVDTARSIFSPLDSLVARANGVPGIAAAVVGRRLPGTIVITVLETVPVAWSLVGGRLALVDEAAEPLPFDPRGQRVRLPIAPADTAVTRALGRLLALDASWFGRVEQVTPGDDRTVEVLLPEGRVRLPGAPTEQLIPDLQAVMTDLAHRGDRWTVIDASYPDRFFVRMAGRLRPGGPPVAIDSLAGEGEDDFQITLDTLAVPPPPDSLPPGPPGGGARRP